MRYKLLILTSLIVGISARCTSFTEKKQAANVSADQQATAQNLPLIYDIARLNIDSAGGVGLTVQIRNTSTKAMKYLIFVLSPYNAVGDRVASEIGNKVQARLSFTGPIPSVRNVDRQDAAAYNELDRQNSGAFPTIWYNSTIRCVKVEWIEITYMDGSQLTIKNKADLMKMNQTYSEALKLSGEDSLFGKEWVASKVCEK